MIRSMETPSSADKPIQMMMSEAIAITDSVIELSELDAKLPEGVTLDYKTQTPEETYENAAKLLRDNEFWANVPDIDKADKIRRYLTGILADIQKRSGW